MGKNILGKFIHILYLRKSESFSELYKVIKYDQGWSYPIEHKEFYERFDHTRSYLIT